MADASIINATVLHNTTYGSMVWMTVPLCAMCAPLAYGRRQHARLEQAGPPSPPG